MAGAGGLVFMRYSLDDSPGRVEADHGTNALAIEKPA
jgi:hypothetical protein